MNVTKMMPSATVVAVAVVVRAGKVNFPGAGAAPDAQGRYDLAALSNWDGGALPATSSEVSITGTPTVVVTASGNIDLGKIWNGVTIDNYASTHRKLIFDMTGYAASPRVNAKGYLWATGGGRYHDTYLKGGYFDLGGGIFCNDGSNAAYLNYANLGISDGAVITNASSMKLGYTGQIGQHIDISGHSKVYINGDFSFQVYGTSAPDFTAEGQNYLRITDGSHFEVNALVWERAGDATTFDTTLPLGQYKDFLVVSNATMTMNSGLSSFGARGYTFTHITDNAAVTGKNGIVFAHDLARGNLLRIDNGGLLRVDGSAYGGWNNNVQKSGANSNRVEVLEGGTLDVGTHFYLCYGITEGNTLFVSNGTFSCGNFYWNYSDVNYGGSSLILSGENASYTNKTTTTALFGFSPSCTFVIENGATYKPTCDAFGYTGDFLSNDVLCVRTGGKFIGSLNNSANSKPTAVPAQVISTDCGIVVENGGQIESSIVRIGGVNGFLRVDNGKLTIDGTEGVAQALQLGFQGAYGGLGTNSVLTLAVTRPEIKVNNAKRLTVERGSKIVFELPAEGYDEGIVPLDISGNVGVWESGCALELADTQAMFDRHQKLGKRADYTLMRVPAGAAKRDRSICRSIRHKQRDSVALICRLNSLSTGRFSNGR